ncbi:MAG: DUF4339 domain-containing protein [Gemmataceae bacterium]
MSNYYYRVGDEAFGPVTSKELRLLAKQGVIGPDTYVRKGESRKWVVARRITGLLPPDDSRTIVEPIKPIAPKPVPMSPPVEGLLLRPAANVPILEPLDDDEEDDFDDKPLPKHSRRRYRDDVPGNSTPWLLIGGGAIGIVVLAIAFGIGIHWLFKSDGDAPKPAAGDSAVAEGSPAPTKDKESPAPPPKKPSLADFVGSWKGTQGNVGMHMSIKADGGCVWSLEQGGDGASTFARLRDAPPWTLILAGIGTQVSVRPDGTGNLQATIDGQIKLTLKRE